MARRTQAEMQQTRAALLSSARKAFTQHGYATTSMDDLCAEVGLTRGALYHHFGDKKGLFQAVVAELDAEMDLRLQQVFDAATDPWLGFQGRCQLFLEMAQEPEIQRIYLQDAKAVLGHWSVDVAQLCVVSMQTILADLMQAGRIQKTNPEALARLINGSLNEATFWIADAQGSAERLSQALAALQLLLNGLNIAAQKLS